MLIRSLSSWCSLRCASWTPAHEIYGALRFTPYLVAQTALTVVNALALLLVFPSVLRVPQFSYRQCSMTYCVSDVLLYSQSNTAVLSVPSVLNFSRRTYDTGGLAMGKLSPRPIFPVRRGLKLSRLGLILPETSRLIEETQTGSFVPVHQSGMCFHGTGQACPVRYRVLSTLDTDSVRLGLQGAVRAVSEQLNQNLIEC